MATRRPSLGLDEGDEPDFGLPNFGSLIELLGNDGSPGSKTPMMGGEVPPFRMPEGEPPPDGTVLGPGPEDNVPIGNTETPREMAPQQTPTSSLPRGVTVEERMPEVFSGGEYESQMSTPAMPSAPSPTAARPPNPLIGSADTPSPAGPVRRSLAPASAPALFGTEAGSPLFGRAGGLLGGGTGVPGTGQGGVPQPTEMMRQILRMLRTRG